MVFDRLQESGRKTVNDQVSVFSQANMPQIRKEKLNADLRSRLQMYWRKVYRDICKEDVQDTFKISCPKFIQILHQKGCFVSREELLKLYQRFGTDADPKREYQLSDFETIFNEGDSQLNYKQMTKDLQLQQSYLDFIQVKNTES